MSETFNGFTEMLKQGTLYEHAKNVHQFRHNTLCKLLMEDLICLIHKVVNVAPKIFGTIK